MNLTAMRAEFLARGFKYIDASGTTRQDLYLNRAYHELCEARPWPFLETDATGASPLTISDLGHVLSVADTVNDVPLYALDRRAVIVADPSANDTGAPGYWFIDGTAVKVWPTTSTTLAVRYIKVAADLTANDTPVVPTRFQPLIIDGAAVLAFRDTNNQEMADALQVAYDRSLADMSSALLDRNYFGPELVGSSRSVFERNC